MSGGCPKLNLLHVLLKASRTSILQGDRGAKCDRALTDGLSMPVSAGEEKKTVAYFLGLYHKQVGLKTIF